MVLLRLVITLLTAAPVAHGNVLAARRTIAPEDTYLVASTRHYKQETWRWQQLMGRYRSPSSQGELDVSHAYRRWVRDLWKQRARTARRQAESPPHKRQWLCIHRYEGGWTLIDGPYYGGLQMDIEFQRAWGSQLLARRGTANRWSPVEQMWVAERAFHSGLGYTPWPNTARMCGLL